MKNKIGLLLTLILFSTFININAVNAAEQGKMELVQEKYQGYPIVQVKNHTNETAKDAMNKVLKSYTSELLATQKANDSTLSIGVNPKTSYNKNFRLSVGYLISYYYEEAAHPETYTNFYNFNSKTGQRVYLKDVLNNSTKISNAKEVIKNKLTDLNKEFGSEMYKTTDIIIDLVKTNFYYADNGIVVFFNTYEAGKSYVAGAVSVSIPYNSINNGLSAIASPTTKSTSKPTPTPTPVSTPKNISGQNIFSDFYQSALKGKLLGVKNVKLGDDLSVVQKELGEGKLLFGEGGQAGYGYPGIEITVGPFNKVEIICLLPESKNEVFGKYKKDLVLALGEPDYDNYKNSQYEYSLNTKERIELWFIFDNKDKIKEVILIDR